MRREREVGEGKMSRRGRREAAGQSGDHQWEGAHGQGRCRCEGRSDPKSDPKFDPKSSGREPTPVQKIHLKIRTGEKATT